MTKYQAGLAVGKFYPPHAGHHVMLDIMESECERPYVAVCHSSVESIPVEDRIAWLEDRHPKARFFAVKDDSPVNYSDDTWSLFLDALLTGGEGKALGLVSEMWDHRRGWFPPEAIYSGESYASEFAIRLRKALSFLDVPEIEVRMMDRSAQPHVSATAFRENPIGNWDLLAPATRAGLCKRVVICGAESSGTTTLAKDLSEFYETTVVPEYGRHYDWAVGKHHSWKASDFYHIAEEQNRWESKLARESQGGLLICDTDDFATSMFALVYLGKEGEMPSLHIQQRAENTPADLYLITSDEGVEFEDDGTRFNSGRRPWMTQWFRSNLVGPAYVVTGSQTERLACAIAHIESTLTWDLSDPIEKRTGYEYEGLVQQPLNS